MRGTRTTIRWPPVCGRPADRTLMVEPDSAEPIWRDIAVSVGAITASAAADNARFS